MMDKTNRRKVLAGIGSLAVAGSAKTVSGKGDGREVYSIRGSLQNPISQDEILELIQAVAEQNGIDSKDVIKPIPSSKGELVSYVVTATNNTIHSDFGFAVNKRDQAALHQRNKDKQKEFKEKSGSEFQTQDTSDWSAVYDDDIVTENCPYGSLQNKYVLYRSDEDPSHFALRDETWAYPGMMDRICDSGYRIADGMTTHNWGRGGHEMDFDYHTPRDDGNRDGTVSVALEASRDPSIEIGYEVEVGGTYYEDSSVEYLDVGEWEYESTGSSAESTSILDTNSLAYRESYEGDWKELVYLSGECDFYDGENVETIEHSVSLTQ
ncbi:hypothetical protein [Natrarchaeobaculum sulfurireducens]|nr:hypothetical protein [Natrarchaeobaculum sulfurireducens]